MCSKGFLKRLLPFFATFAVGIFIASFFVNINAPTFRGGRGKRHHEMNRLRAENEALRNENLRLQNDLESFRWDSSRMRHMDHPEWSGPDVSVPVPLTPPPPPVAARAKR